MGPLSELFGRVAACNCCAMIPCSLVFLCCNNCSPNIDGLVGQASAPESYEARLREAGAPPPVHEAAPALHALCCWCEICSQMRACAGWLTASLWVRGKHESPGTDKAVELQHTHGWARGLEVAEAAVPKSASFECSSSSVANHLECGTAEPNPVIYIILHMFILYYRTEYVWGYLGLGLVQPVLATHVSLRLWDFLLVAVPENIVAF